MSTFGDTARDALSSKNISQTTLAKEVSISRVQLNRYMTGKTVPKLDVALRISRFLGFSLDVISLPEVQSQ